MLSFLITPFEISEEWPNIVHATIGRNGAAYGDRTPAVWFYAKSTKLYICSAVNGNRNYCYTSSPLPLHKQSNIQIQQLQLGHQYYFQIIINGHIVLNVLNKQPRVFKNVKYYASSPWYAPAKATIRRFRLFMFKHRG